MAGFGDELKQRLPEIALAILAAKQGGPQALAAFQGSVNQSRQQQQERADALARQAQMDEERRSQQAAVEARAQRDDTRADEAARFQRLNQALSSYDKYATGVSETAMDPVVGENQILSRGAQLEGAYGLPQGQLSAFVPSLTKPISDRKAATIRRLAKAKLDEVSKVYPQEAIVSGSARFASRELADLLGDEYKPEGLSGPELMRYSELDARTVGGQAVQPMLSNAPTPGSFEEYTTAPPERKAAIEADRKRYMQADDRPVVQGAGGTARPLTEGQRANVISTRRNQWQRLSKAVTDRETYITRVDSGLAALDRGNRNAATQAIIIAFNKLQDETSVVREGEYARSEQLVPLVNRIEGAIRRVTLGGASMTDADLKALAFEAKEIARAMSAVSNEAATNLRQGIEEELSDYNIPPSRVFGGSTVGVNQAAPADEGWVEIDGIRIRERKP